jgi:hypothetical protein
MSIEFIAENHFRYFTLMNFYAHELQKNPVAVFSVFILLAWRWCSQRLLNCLVLEEGERGWDLHSGRLTCQKPAFWPPGIRKTNRYW